jgi:ABC-type lipoprotein release transport system permease subunit
VLAALLFGGEPLDWLSFGLGVLLMMAVTIAATLAPALRAASIGPLLALRHE